MQAVYGGEDDERTAVKLALHRILFVPSAGTCAGLVTMIVDLSTLKTPMDNLADETTRVVLLDLSQITADVPTIMQVLAVESFGCPLPAWDVDEIREFATSSGVKNVVVLIYGAHLLPAAILGRIFTISQSIGGPECTLVWIFDDLYGVLHLPLIRQMDFDIVHIKPRPPADCVLEIVGELLSHQLVPTAEVIEKLLQLAAAGRHAKSSVKRYIKAH